MSERNPWEEIAFLNTPPGIAYSDSVCERMGHHRPPYRAMFAGKGAECDFPWIIVGAPGWNMLGVLMSHEQGLWAADVMNRASEALP